MIFPRFMYHEEHGVRLFKDEAEYVASEPGWQDTPIWVRDEEDHNKWRRVDDESVTAVGENVPVTFSGSANKAVDKLLEDAGIEEKDIDRSPAPVARRRRKQRK